MLLAGLGGSIAEWRRNTPALTAACFVIAFDHRGSGRSDEPGGRVAMGTFVDDAIALLDAVGIDRAHIYGQSFGGMVALGIALAHPDRTRTLILAATSAGSSRSIAVDERTVPKGEPWRGLYAPGFPEAHPEHVAEDLAATRLRAQHRTGER